MTTNRFPQIELNAFLCFLGAVIAFQLSANIACGEESPKPTATPSSSASPSPLPKVISVDGLVKLRETLAVKCERLKEWAQTKGNDAAKLVLYLDGTPMKGIRPKCDKVNDNEIFFTLERIADNDEKKDNRKAWDALLCRPKALGKDGAIRVTIGPETGVPFDSDETTPLFAIDRWSFFAYSVLLLLLLVGMWRLATTSDLLRDSGPAPAEGPKAYSLAWTQMAFWFFLIVAAYAFIWMVTGAMDTITASVLGLMGISAATGLGAVAVDNSKRTQAATELDKLRTEQARLQGEQQAHPDTFTEDSKRRLADLRGLIAAQVRLLSPSLSRGFWLDLVSDGDGVSFHRLQIAVWTVVLGFMFVVSVYNILSMPTFSDTLLGLMGISGGTYVGFKLPEKLN